MKEIYDLLDEIYKLSCNLTTPRTFEIDGDLKLMSNISGHFREEVNGNPDMYIDGISLDSVIHKMGYDNLKFTLEGILLELM